jgi:ribose 5-phosphate isomerase A
LQPPVERLKELAGRRAAEYVEGGMRVGLGSGSTVRYTILALGERQLDITCVATSEKSATLAAEVGLRVVPPDSLGHVDVAVDGADEVDPHFNLVKGGGGAHTREKIVASMADRFIVVVDEAKLVPRLGAFGLPLEALPFAPGVVVARVMELGAAQVSRRPEPSDNGNVLLDAAFGSIDDPGELARRLAEVPGLVDHGLFPAEMVERVVVAGAGGVRELIRPRQ